VLTFELPSLRIEILDGDIADQDVDAVVNAANNQFWMGAGVAGALKARGGTSIETEAMRLGPVTPGDCVVTSGGLLKARHVIHAAVMGQDLRTSAALIERATRNSLALAEQRQLTSIAFPAFGTGVGGFPVRECAGIMIGAIRAHDDASRKDPDLSRPPSVRLVRVVLFGTAAYRAFAEAACDLLERPIGGPPDCPISS
jgi:O-acetyl-ADP-ribose deacetylase (regulator of RNase III)